MQVQAQQRSSDALTTNIIPSSQKVHQEYIVPKSDAILTLTKMNTCMTSLISFPLFWNQHSFQLTQDYKGILKACNRV